MRRLCSYLCTRLGIWLTFALLAVAGTGGALPIRVFNTENGLPHNRINRIYPDSRGFLWICTDDGLSRFDGHQFVNYTTTDGLPHIHVNAMLETRTGEYWLATDGGLSRFDPRPGEKRFTNYAPSGPLEAQYINSLIEDQDGSLLLGTNSGLYRFQTRHPATAFEPVDFGASSDIPGAAKVHAITHDARGRLWLGTEHGLYRRGEDGKWTRYGAEDGLPGVFVLSLGKEKEDRIWVGLRGGFGRIAVDPKPGAPVLDFVQTEKDGLVGRDVRAIWFGANGRRWIATDRGLMEWMIDSNRVSRFRAYAVQDGLPVEEILSLAEDAASNLWVGTRRSGLLRAGQSRFQTFSRSDGLQLGGDQTLLEARSGEVCIFDVGDRQTQVYRQKDGHFTAAYPTLPGSAAATVPHWLQMALEDHKGAWWFSTPYGLFRFPALDAHSDLRLLPQCAIDRFFEDSAGDIWISARRPGQSSASLARWERRSGRIHDETDRLPADARTLGIAAFAQDRAGQLWIGLQRPGGLFRLTGRGFEPFAKSLHGHIYRLFIDSRGRLWIASTESGLGLIVDPTSSHPQLQRYTRAQGLSGEEVWCVTEDRFGRIYAGTAQGVDRLDPSNGHILHYSVADGLIHGDIRSALRDRNGDLWFVSSNGVSRLIPDEDRTVRPSPTRITGLRIAGAPLSLSEFGETKLGPMRVSSQRNSLQIDFAATDYHVLTPLRYQFLLDGTSRTWQDAGTSSTVHLVNLAPSQYKFRVRALTPDGLPGEPASFAFTILPPFWRRWQFQLACALTIAAFSYWMHTHRLKNRLAIEKVRSRIATDLHDDIGASLSRISVIGEALKSNLKAGDAEVQRMLNDVTDSSRRLITDMGDIVWSLDPRRDQIGDLASRLRAFGSDLLEARGMEWRVEAPVDALRQTVPPDVRRQLYLVFKEGIHNIARHSEAKEATLNLRFQEGYLYGELADDGCGIRSARRDGIGLPSMRARTEQLGGTFDISAAARGGTLIRIRVPLAKRA